MANKNNYAGSFGNTGKVSAIAFLLMVFFGVYLYTENQISHIRAQGHHAYLLIERLRQSADELSRMALAYAATGEARYKAYHQDLLDIRNGTIASPKDYSHAYWDRVLAGQAAAPSRQGKGTAWLDLVREAGFTKEELAQAGQAVADADRLAGLESAAMARLESDRAGAQESLFGDAYLRARAAAMDAIADSQRLAEAHTLSALAEAERAALVCRWILLAGALAALAWAWRSRRDLYRCLGGGGDEIQAHMRRIGQGDLSLPIKIPPGAENSILAGLSDMQALLHGQDTARRQSEGVLREKKSQLKALFNTLTAGIIVIDEQGIIEDLNPACEALFGYGAEELKGRNVNMLMPEPFHGEHDGYLKNYLETGNKKIGEQGREVIGRRKDGTSFPMVILVSEAPQSGTRAFYGFVLDISERKQAESLLRRYKTVIETARDGFWVVDLDGNIVEANQSYAEISGYDLDELCRMQVSQIEVIEDAEGVMAHIAKIRRQGHDLFETRHRRKDGSEFEVEVAVNYMADEQMMFAFLRGIDERKRAEEALRQSKQLMDSIVNNMPAMVFLKRADDLRFELVNRAGEEFLGYSADALLGKNDYDLFPREQADFFTSEDRKALAAKAAVNIPEEKITTACGQTRYLFSRKVSLNDIAGKPLYLLGISVDITERKQLEQSLSFRQFSLDHAGEEIFWIGQDARILDANKAAYQKLGYTHAELCGLTIIELDPLYPPEKWAEHWLELKCNKVLRFESVHRHRDGTLFPVEIVANYFEYEGQEYNCALAHDISERKKAEEELRIAAATFETHEAIMITDADATILRVNHAFERITGYSAEFAIGKTPRILSSGRHGKDFYQAMWKSLLEVGIWEGEIWDRRKNGEVYPKWLTITALKDSSGRPTEYVALFTDISERKQAEEEIRHLAFYDPLTTLPNRRLLLDRLNQALSSSERSRQHGALLFLDMDNFKSLNDRLGHNVGDQMLVEIAHRIKSNIREADTAARLGGDEFVVLFENMGLEVEEASQRVAVIAEKIRATLSEPFRFNQHVHASSPSIGVCVYQGSATSADELIKHADIAMYQAKNTGRNRIQFFDPVLQQAVETRATLESDLRRALAGQQLCLYYQIQYDNGGLPIGAEALIRWRHPERKLILPDQFIPLAEESSLILDIGKWVVETACRQLAEWGRHPKTRDLPLAINVSPHQFMTANFVESIQAALKTYGVEPSRLKLELTESVILNDVEEIVRKMRVLKTFGVRLSLDDFGTGYSSLSYLKRLPISQIKIDKSFVRDIASNRNDAVMVKNIIDIATNFSLNVIAEGVETQEQLEFLKLNGCMAYQGYLFGKPVPIEEFEAQIDQRPRR